MLKDKERLAACLTWVARKRIATRFVESGTGDGNTALWAAKLFKEVITIEEDGAKYEKFVLKNQSRVVALRGSSTETLVSIVLPDISTDTGTVFWLDSHRHLIPAGSPVLEELLAIRAWGGPAIVLVDNYTLFSLQPMDKSLQMGWPSHVEIIGELLDWGLPYRVINDVIVAITPVLLSMPDFLYGAYPNRMGPTSFD